MSNKEKLLFNNEKSEDATEMSVRSNLISLDFPLPTEYVDLPSKGKFYDPEHPLHGKEMVQINFMTAKDEDILSNKMLLKKGKAIEKFIEHILVDKSIKSSDLLVGDKNAILIAARISGYGNIYEASVMCKYCGTRMTQKFDLNEVQIKNGGIIENDGKVRIGAKGHYIVKLERSGWEVELKPLFGKDEEYLFNLVENARKSKKEVDLLLAQLRLIIVSIIIGDNVYSDSSQIEKAISVMPAGDSRAVRNKYYELFPDIIAKKSIVCVDCEGEQEVDMPFDVGFFWSK